LPPGQLPVYLDPVEFRQAGLNLALNRADAIPDRGRLSFSVTAYKSAPELKHHWGQLPQLPCVCLSVTDNGTGIPAGQLSRLFEPSFTAKQLAGTAALGLRSARLFVEGHGGAISVESNEEKGTTWCLWLPQADI